jgi:phosphoenolpyruvate-protein phosphotransferase (PTS system enzyme I)
MTEAVDLGVPTPQPAGAWIERDVVVSCAEGLHARPAAGFVNIARAFSSEIEIEKDGKKARGKSTVAIMLLGVPEGARIKLRATGQDAGEAVAELAEFLGEKRHGDRKIEEASETLAPSAPPTSTVTGTSLPARDNRITGVPASPGVVVGPVFLHIEPKLEAKRTRISADEVDAEVDRFRAALDAVRSDIASGIEVHDNADTSVDREEAAILRALLDVVGDPEIIGAIEERIRGSEEAATATLAVGALFAQQFRGMESDYLRARAEDIEHLTRQVAAHLLDIRLNNFDALQEPSIVVANSLSTLDLARIDPENLLGLLVAEGGMTSHIAIVARALGVPAVLGISAATAAMEKVETVALDGGDGYAILNPNGATIRAFEEKRGTIETEKAALESFKTIEPVTVDGRRIEVAANLGSESEINNALISGAMGVGLFRTELMFTGARRLPSEERQYEVYAKLLTSFSPYAVVIRTLDVGGDKPLPGLNQEKEENPFLGWRGIRMCLDLPNLFKPQLRALLRATTKGRLRVMFPMISDVSEVRAAKAMMEECGRELTAEGVEWAMPEIGIMIETPAAALCASALAKEVDFFSIGTNDLTQYTMAVDRTNARLERLNRTSHPAVLRLIELTARAATEAGIWVGICGEAAADPALIPTFLSFGVTELSMSPSLIPQAKKIIGEMSILEEARIDEVRAQLRRQRA